MFTILRAGGSKMSRIGSKPIVIPGGVTVKLEDSKVVASNGKETLITDIPSVHIAVEIEENQVLVKRDNDSKKTRSLHGLTRSLINNNLIGLSEGFKKNLEINGVGYRAVKEGKNLVLNLGYSHQIILEEPDGITIDVPKPNRITVSGADKQMVGEIAAKIRSYRKPDVYKGKGVRYEGEYVRIKAGKTGASA
jgi:large subunit ribosomal protein L6